MFNKLIITCDLVVRTGMHIGTSEAFSAIGAVDSTVVRDALTGYPIVPGSSLKGKLRTLLVKCEKGTKNGEMPKIEEDPEDIRRLFGSSETHKTSLLQFSDCFVQNADVMSAVGMTEVKAENVINRITSVANPRFIERVTPGTVFGVKIVYDEQDADRTRDDFAFLAKGFKLLQLDYLGGHGTRGSGRVSFRNFAVSSFLSDVTDTDELKQIFDEVADYELFGV